MKRFLLSFSVLTLSLLAVLGVQITSAEQFPTKDPPQGDITPTFSGLKVNGDSTVNGFFTVGNSIRPTAGKSLTLDGITTITQGAQLNQSLNVLGTTSLKATNIDGDVTPTDADKTLNVLGSVGSTGTGTFDVGTKVGKATDYLQIDPSAINSYGKDLQINNLSGKSINLMGDVVVDKGFQVNGELTLGGKNGIIEGMEEIKNNNGNITFQVASVWLKMIANKSISMETASGSVISVSNENKSVNITGKVTATDGFGTYSATPVKGDTISVNPKGAKSGSVSCPDDQQLISCGTDNNSYDISLSGITYSGDTCTVFVKNNNTTIKKNFWALAMCLDAKK